MKKKEVVVKCAQTGKKLKAKVGDLSREDQQPLKEKDLTKGSNLVVTTNGTDYPVVSFVNFASNAIQEPRFPLKLAVTNKRTTLEAAKEELDSKITGPPPAKKQRTDSLETENLDPNSTSMYQSTDRNLLVVIDKKLDLLLERLRRIEEKIRV